MRKKGETNEQKWNDDLLYGGDLFIEADAAVRSLQEERLRDRASL